MDTEMEDYEIQIKEEDNDLDDMEQPEDSTGYINDYNDSIPEKKYLSLKYQHNKNIVKIKRKRNMNFTTQECELLVDLIRESKIIDRINSSNESYSFYERKEEWQRIESSFNQLTKTVTRNASSLKEKYKIIKRNILMKLKTHLDKNDSGRVLLNCNDFKKFEKVLLPILLPKIGFVSDEQDKGSTGDNKEQNDNSEDADFLNVSFPTNSSQMTIPDMITSFKTLENDHDLPLNLETVIHTPPKLIYYETKQEELHPMENGIYQMNSIKNEEVENKNLFESPGLNYERILERNKNRRLRRIQKMRRNKKLRRKDVRDVVLNCLKNERGRTKLGVDFVESKRKKEIELLEAQIERVRSESRREEELHKLKMERLRNEWRMDEERFRSEERRKEESHQNEERRKEESHKNEERRKEEKHQNLTMT